MNTHEHNKTYRVAGFDDCQSCGGDNFHFPDCPLNRPTSQARDQSNETRDTCDICCQPASNPFRVYDERGKVTEGCVSAFHTGHLISISESNHWHNRPQAKTIRRSLSVMKLRTYKAQQ